MRVKDGVITVEVPIERLIEALYADWETIDNELKQIMALDNMPEELLPYVKQSIRHDIIKMMEERQIHDESIIEPLMKLYIRYSYIILCDP
jgi:hypothetical protein